MPRIRFTARQLISKLREVEIPLAKDETLPRVCRALAISEQTLLSMA